MKIIEAKVEWLIGYINDPSIHILSNDYPNQDDFIYKQKGSLYYGVAKKDWVSFFFYSSPGDGYGGQEFSLIMDDGTVKKIKGPWSSRAGTMNGSRMYRLFNSEPCVEVVRFQDKKSWDRGFTGITAAITYSQFEKACKLAGVHCVCRVHTTEDCGKSLDAVSYLNGFTIPGHQWSLLPDGPEFSFHPSLYTNRITKPEK